jgi:hypothetical protein
VIIKFNHRLKLFLQFGEDVNLVVHLRFVLVPLSPLDCPRRFFLSPSLMRHANVSVTMDEYVQAVTPAKRAAQRGIVGLLDQMDREHHGCLQVIEKMVGAIGFEPMTSTV